MSIDFGLATTCPHYAVNDLPDDMDFRAEAEVFDCGCGFLSDFFHFQRLGRVPLSLERDPQFLQSGLPVDGRSATVKTPKMRTLFQQP